jgi:hypothetical protein
VEFLISFEDLFLVVMQVAHAPVRRSASARRRKARKDAKELLTRWISATARTFGSFVAYMSASGRYCSKLLRAGRKNGSKWSEIR